jgi:hypothetical protein
MSRKYYLVHASYNDDDVLMDAVKTTREANYEIEEVYTPFPVHGLDKAMGLKPTRIAIASFLFGLTGFLTALAITNYMMIVDWPQNFGGKPNFTYADNAPAFVTILFELTIFFAAHLMVITFYMRSRLWPWKEAENPNPRTTDDLFVMELEVDENPQKAVDFLKSTGAEEVTVKEMEDADYFDPHA